MKEREGIRMSDKRIFTDEELKEMGTPTLDLIKRAVDAGEKEKAKRLAERLQSEIGHLHDGYMVWVSGLLSYIYRNYGVDAVEKAEREAHGIEGRSVFKPSGKTDLRSRVEEMASGLRGHMQPVVIKEDDEKITLTMKPCGSGERLIKMGLYEPEFGLAKIKERHPATWGMKDFPIYCCHCRLWRCLQ
jgi:hypothetical protein